MPIYEYKCDHCGKKFEVIKTSANPRPYEHCSCGKDAVKVVSNFSFKIWSTDISNFGTPEYAEARRRECGVDS